MRRTATVTDASACMSLLKLETWIKSRRAPHLQSVSSTSTQGGRES